jgi:hypothetical protein
MMVYLSESMIEDAAVEVALAKIMTSSAIYKNMDDFDVLYIKTIIDRGCCCGSSLAKIITSSDKNKIKNGVIR